MDERGVKDWEEGASFSGDGKKSRLWVLERFCRVRCQALLAGSSKNRVYKPEVWARM